MSIRPLNYGKHSENHFGEAAQTLPQTLVNNRAAVLVLTASAAVQVYLVKKPAYFGPHFLANESETRQTARCVRISSSRASQRYAHAAHACVGVICRSDASVEARRYTVLQRCLENRPQILNLTLYLTFPACNQCMHAGNHVRSDPQVGNPCDPANETTFPLTPPSLSTRRRRERM